MKTSGFMHSINASETPKLLALPVVVAICTLTVILGGVGGFMMVKKTPAVTSTTQKGTSVQTNTSAGVVDKKTFKDSAEGMLKEGGLEGEGNFHLERPGGVSQNAYLTSSTVDLSKYVGKKVKVWGQTFTGQKAGWLMDVGLVEIQ
ncbi:MAG: hypothetical protein NTZ55_03500 [Candidatus Roizmanbacteria bacterium]|nr:hypothetical protein [Candidatus Roizmanbacteria bacterium]